MSSHLLKIKKLILCSVLSAGVLLTSAFLYIPNASAAVLSVSPATGSFVVGSTFTVSVLLNSENQTINTIAATLLFPADRLQLVSPSTGNSIISLWTALPFVDNEAGKITMQGGIPNGIQVGNGLITSLVFRVKAVGSAFLKFSDNSRVLLNDGQGSDVLHQLNNAVFTLTLPPPAGPVVASDTHPDQAVWYAQRDASIRWAATEPVDSYSYVLNDQPIEYPDDIPEGLKTSVEYHGLSDGIHYFHIKALHNNSWGGTTHFGIKIDTTPPADFPVQITPGKRTSNQQPIVQFQTTDALSGMDHYELRLIPLHLDEPNPTGAKDLSKILFIEASSPYIPSALQHGTYDVVVRAFDAAANSREVTTHLAIVSPLFQFIGSDGVSFGGSVLIGWPFLFGLLLLLLIGLLYLAWRSRKWHGEVHSKIEKKELPNHVQAQLAELKRYRSKYGLLIWLVCVVIGSQLVNNPAKAADVAVTPPVITTISHSITNNEIFYIGGKSDTPSSTIVVYVQNLSSGETTSEISYADQEGNWFYRHNSFLSGGDYRLWVQTKKGDVLSPPSPEQIVRVRTDAIQIGVSRISFEALYLVLIVLALMLILLLSLYILFHSYRARQKRTRLQKEIREAEESVRRGFAVLRHDVQNELDVIRKVKLSKELSATEATREEQLLKDLQAMEAFIGKEIWDIEKTELQPN